MSGSNDIGTVNGEISGANDPAVVIVEEGGTREILTEIIVSDDPPDDDTSTIWTDAGDGDLEIGFEDGGMDMSDFNIDSNVVEMAVCKFDGHTDSVYCAAVHPKQRLVITGGGDDKGFLWKYNSLDDSVSNGQVISSFQLDGHTDTVTSVGFNFDGTLALTGSYDGTVRIWEVETGALKLTLEGPEDVEWAQWHSKGNAVLAGSKDGTIWMWLAHNGQCVQVFAGHDGAVSSGCFTKDGKMVCSGGEDGTIRLWAPKTGACKHVFEGHFGHEASVTCLVGSTDGDLLLSGSEDGTVKLLQISGKKVLQTYVHSRPKPLTGESGPDMLPPPPGTVGKAPSAGASGGAGISRGLEDDDGLYDIEEETEGAEEGDAEVMLSVECVGFSEGSFRWAASGGMDNTLKVWDLVSGSCRTVCMHGGSVVALAWHSSLPIISTAALDNVVRVWDARSGTLLLELTGHTNLVTSLIMTSLSPNDVAVSTGGCADAVANTKEGGSGGHATVAEGSDGLAGTVVAGGDEVESVARRQVTQGVASDVIVSVSDDRTARIFHINTASLLA